MLRFIWYGKNNQTAESVISIHLMLRFINRAVLRLWWCGSISIHLMLRFIKELLAIKLIANIFQYISCYGLSRCCCLSDSPFGISIHLMLRFINYENWNWFQWIIFQYISCYGLSTLARILSKRENDFNTSHVTVYQNYQYIKWIYDMISIHLMLRFIAYLASVCASSTSFQYISCYGLSSKHYRKCHKISYFNTSHVTVYRGTHSVDFGLCIRFQYISCYGLSPHSVSLFGTIQAISIHLMLRFITVESP